MTSHEGPRGHIAFDETVTIGERPRVRWLGLGRPRRLGAALLLASAAATFWVTEVSMGRSFTTMPTGGVAALQFAPLVSGAVVTVGLAVFVLGGSLASRILGSLAAAAGLLPLLLPFLLVARITLDDLGPVALPWAAALALHLLTILALLWPPHGRAHPGEGVERDDEP